jgi:SAM-dependent methyltransferase
MSDSSLRETLRSYDRHSPSFACRYAEVDTAVERQWFLEAIEGRQPGFVLDAGCGAGRDTLALHSTSHGVTGIAGIDLSPGMLHEARRLAPALPVALADLRSLPLRSQSCAGVWALASLVHLDDAGVHRALEEFRRVLRPGGVLFVSMMRGELSDWKADGVHTRRWFNFEAGSRLPTVVEQLGFQVENRSLGADQHTRWVNVLAVRP